MSDSEKESCPSCQGTGKCLRCNGSGNVMQPFPTPIAIISGQVRGQGKSTRTCSKCYGSGMCSACKGSGKAQ